MGAVYARIEPLATEQQLQYERMMGQWVALYRHLISQRLLVLERVSNQPAAKGATLIERQQLARLSALVDEMQAALRQSDRQKTEQLNNQLLDALRSYDSAPPPIIISPSTPTSPSASPSATASASATPSISAIGGHATDSRMRTFRAPIYHPPRFSYRTKDLGWTFRF